MSSPLPASCWRCVLSPPPSPPRAARSSTRLEAYRPGGSLVLYRGPHTHHTRGHLPTCYHSTAYLGAPCVARSAHRHRHDRRPRVVNSPTPAGASHLPRRQTIRPAQNDSLCPIETVFSFGARRVTPEDVSSTMACALRRRSRGPAAAAHPSSFAVLVGIGG